MWSACVCVEDKLTQWVALITHVPPPSHKLHDVSPGSAPAAAGGQAPKDDPRRALFTQQAIKRPRGRRRAPLRARLSVHLVRGHVERHPRHGPDHAL